MGGKANFADFIKEAEERGCSLWEVALENEVQHLGLDREQIWQQMAYSWQVMQEALAEGIKPGLKSFSGLVGGEGKQMLDYLSRGKTLSGEGTAQAAARALGVSVVSASMGKIVAAPTAGSCGILPAVLQTAADRLGSSEEELIRALFTAAAVGVIIDENASTSGAKGGCQAECGAASAMAAVAVVEMAGGTPAQSAHAGAIALKSVIGLACDPVAGLVEVPCVKRNAMGASNALLAADMALAGIESKIPLDEVIIAMGEVGEMLPACLRETAQGGLAATPTARQIEKEVLGK